MESENETEDSPSSLPSSEPSCSDSSNASPDVLSTPLMSKQRRRSAMLKRSLRLAVNGYYDSYGEQTISYRETRVRRTRRKRLVRRGLMDGDSLDSYQDNDMIFNIKEEIVTLKQRRGIIFFILLLFGCSCLFSARHLRSSESFVTLTTEDTTATVDTAATVDMSLDKDPEKIPEPFHEDLQEIKKEMEKKNWLPSATSGSLAKLCSGVSRCKTCAPFDFSNISQQQNM